MFNFLVPFLILVTLTACNEKKKEPTISSTSGNGASGSSSKGKKASKAPKSELTTGKNTPATRPAKNPPRISLRMTNMNTRKGAIELADFLNVYKKDMSLDPSVSKEIILGSKINHEMNFKESIDHSVAENKILNKAFGTKFSFYPVQAQDGADAILVLGTIEQPGIPFSYRKDLLIKKQYLCNEFTFYSDEFEEKAIKENYYFDYMFNNNGTDDFPSARMVTIGGRKALQMRMDNLHNEDDLTYLTDQVVDLKPYPIVTFDWLGRERFALMDGRIYSTQEVLEHYLGDEYMKLQIACVLELRSGTGWY